MRDPYEVKTVKLAPSTQPNSGQGVFLLRDIPEGRFACMYSLYLYRTPDQTDLYRSSCSFNTSKSVEYRRHCKKYSLGLSSYKALIDIPPEFDVNPLPNLGPKVNHHFRFNNSGYTELEHPRWGLIQSVTAMHDLRAGDELFTFYGYKPGDFPEDFPWYWETKLAIDKEDRLAKKKSLVKKKMKRQKS